MADTKPIRKIVSASLAFHTYMVLAGQAAKQRRTLSWLVNQICEVYVIQQDRENALVDALNHIGKYARRRKTT